MPYRDELPEDCPPETATEIEAPLQVYRLVRTNPPTDADFASVRTENPTKPPFPDAVKECRANGVSVFLSAADALDRRKQPKHQGKSLCRVHLGPGTGRLEKNWRKSHHTWWPLATFDLLLNCHVEEQ